MCVEPITLPVNFVDPESLCLAQIGTLSGVSAETGNFTLQAKASGQDVKERLLEYRLTVRQNTDANVQISTDEGYELVETVTDLSKEDMPAQGEQTMCSVGAYEEFVALYIYATLAMIAGFAYLLLCFTERRRGMTEETKKEAVARLAGWARQGGKFRRMLAFAAIFVLLLYYHGTKNLYCPAEEEPCRKYI